MNQPELNQNKSGFVAIIGLPNVGKSTLFNAVMGQKLSIVSPKPQTTRYRLTGIFTAPEGQLALIDVPGLFRPKSHFQETMVQRSRAALEGADLVWYILSAAEYFDQNYPFGQHTPLILSLQKEGKLILVINKVDAIAKPKLLPMLDSIRAALLPQEKAPFPPIVPLSARQPSDRGAKLLLSESWNLLPESPQLYPREVRTDRGTEFFVAEFVREQIFRLIGEEVPYATGVVIDHWEKKKKGRRDKFIFWANICVTKETHKGILIGEEGARLKAIGTKARTNLTGLLRAPCELFLHVSVKPEWERHDPFALEAEEK